MPLNWTSWDNITEHKKRQTLTTSLRLNPKESMIIITIFINQESTEIENSGSQKKSRTTLGGCKTLVLYSASWCKLIRFALSYLKKSRIVNLVYENIVERKIAWIYWTLYRLCSRSTSSTISCNSENMQSQYLKWKMGIWTDITIHQYSFCQCIIFCLMKTVPCCLWK